MALTLFPKYNDGIPEGSRLDVEKAAQFEADRARLASPEGLENIRKVKELSKFAEEGFCSRFSHIYRILYARVPQNCNAQ